MFLNKFLEILNPISVLIWITFANSCFFLNKKTTIHKLLFSIIIVSAITELLSIILLILNQDLNLLYTISIIFCNSCWLYLLHKLFELKKNYLIVILIYLIISFLNLLFIEKNDLNYITFIIGAMVYIIIFLNESFFQLKKENLLFFKSNLYLLAFAPILFFFGLSFVFAFRNSSIKDTVVFGITDLYSFIVYIINVVYYVLINFYFYRERKFLND